MNTRVESEPAPSSAERLTICLDGTWEVGESKDRNNPPSVFDRLAPVPGLLHSATPPFPDVGRFASVEQQYNRLMMPAISGGMVKPEIDNAALSSKCGGVAYQDRDYFWYRRRFQAPPARRHALLEILKAQFGSEIWLNGVRVGARDGCFTSGTYDISEAIRWEAENEILIRIGAHPGVLPEGNACNTDFEKELWTPGIWDSVEIHCFDGPAIRSVQIAPRLTPQHILIEVAVENLSAAPSDFTLVHQVCDLDGGHVAEHRETMTLQAHERVAHRSTIPLPSAQIWSPASPALYWLESSTSGDTVRTRFGMREFRFETATKRAYLNNKQIFLRGSDITLHRFFEDPLCGALPWDEDWVRRLLGEIPKKLHWNTIKFCIGPVPRKWFDIADELGLMVINEFPLWTLSPELFRGYEKTFDRAVLKQEMSDWLRDGWNHPSVIYWNSCLESVLPWLSREIVRDVRKLDLSNRAWQNSWVPPTDPDDPVEDHPYEFGGIPKPGQRAFDMTNLQTRGGFERQRWGSPSGHATVITEYAWLWLNRDGSPTLLTKALYPTLPYPTATAAERIGTASYLLAGLTEYWRSFQHHAGVLFYGYLASSTPDGFTSDYFADVEKLELHPDFEDYVAEAFKPLGVYLNFWERELQAGATQDLFVMLYNDELTEKSGELSVTLNSPHETIELDKADFFLAPLGQQTHQFRLRISKSLGTFTLTATASGIDGSRTVSRRWVDVHDSIEPRQEPVQEAQFGQQF